MKIAKEKVEISDDDEKKIFHARKSLLFTDGGTWTKKDGLLDVTMDAYDEIDVCELVGKFLLNKISGKYHKNSIGLFRVDGLSLFKNKSSTQLKKAYKKHSKHLFRNSGRI